MSPIQRKIAASILFVGAAVGLSSGFRAARQCRAERRASFESYVTKTCADAIRSADRRDPNKVEADGPEGYRGSPKAP